MSSVSAPVAHVGAQNKVRRSLRAFQQTSVKMRPLGIKRIVRPLRGGSQARLVEGEDGRFYVAKFAGNPQGNRTLVNEWIAQSILSQLGISTPPLCVLRLPKALRSEALYFIAGDKRIRVEGDSHLGSLCPVNPETKVIFDFLPVRLLENVSNLNDFAKVFVIDQWLYQVDQRQAVFIRERGSLKDQIRFRAHFIDHGMAFAGSSWELREAPGHGLYVDRAVYSFINMREICERTVSQIEQLTEDEVFSAQAMLPSSWLTADDNEKLSRLLEDFHKNRLKLRRVVTSQLKSLDLHENGR